jgi:polysaccharide deacetylase family protein (PEP-CTERM system associated)
MNQITNALTIDVEDYFQVSALAPHFPRKNWDSVPCRVERNVGVILDLLAEHDTSATFFTLGWIAERYPELVRRIADSGHEIASHGYAHERVSAQSRECFLSDLVLAKAVLEDVTGKSISGYRAPSFSIGKANTWAHDCIVETGHKYSSSIYPVHHDHYGNPDAPRFPYRLDNGLLEVPITTMRWLGRNWPAGGGGYFRLLPYALSRWQIGRVNRNDLRAAIFYFHPWELDPDQPRVKDATAKTRFRHYLNLDRTEGRLRRLLSDFKWGRADMVFRDFP